MTENYDYLAKSLSGFSGVPVRVYENGKLCCKVFPAGLPKDPADLYLNDLLAVSGHVGYYVTPLFHYYGVLSAGEIKIVAGPTAQIMAGEQKLRELAFQADIPPKDVPAFLEGMNAIRRLPVESLLQILFTVNYFLNGGETLKLSDVTILEAEQSVLKNDIEQERTARVYEKEPENKLPHNTLAVEEALMGIVAKGDTVAMRRWMGSAPAVEGGKIAGDQLRQMRNLFIVTATLVSRAAIQGGMREDEAFSLSDAYIRRVELLTGHGDIINLQYHMVLEFTEQVERFRRGVMSGKLSLDAADYVRRHLSEPVSAEKMAKEFFLSRPYLSSRFRRETGKTLTDFILTEKTEEAKRLLRYSEKSLSAISAYLGFSSHSHFSRVFKKYTGLTPGEYRAKYR